MLRRVQVYLILVLLAALVNGGCGLEDNDFPVDEIAIGDEANQKKRPYAGWTTFSIPKGGGSYEGNCNRNNNAQGCDQKCRQFAAANPCLRYVSYFVKKNGTEIPNFRCENKTGFPETYTCHCTFFILCTRH